MISKNDLNTNWMDRLQSSYAVALAFSIGGRDGINLFSVSLTWLFLFYVTYAAKSKRSVIFIGVIASVIQFLTVLLLVHGILDLMVSKEAVIWWFKIFYWILGFAFILMGGIFFRDWLHHLADKGEKIRIKMPQASGEEVSASSGIFGKFLNYSRYTFVAAAYGILVVVLGSIATQDYHIFMMIMEAKKMSNVSVAQNIAGSYALSFVFPTLLAIVIAFCYKASEEIRSTFSRSISMIKIICSAVYLSLGIGIVISLIYF